MTAEGAFLRPPSRSVDRDRWGRPMIFPPGVTNPALRMPYTRASSLANFIENSYAIHRWEQRHLTRGLGEREDLAAMAAGLPWGPDYDFTPTSTKLSLDLIAEEAMNYAGRNMKANWGTAMHSFTDPVAGKGDVPERMKTDVEAYDKAMAGVDIIYNERFVVCDELRAAGSFDYVLDLPEVDGWVIADKKTGRYSEHSFAIQTAVYTHGLLYEDNQRQPWDIPLNPDWGVIIWIPRDEGKCSLHWIDLRRGWQAARHAAWVRDWQAVQNLSQPYVRGTVPS